MNVNVNAPNKLEKWIKEDVLDLHLNDLKVNSVIGRCDHHRRPFVTENTAQWI